MNPVLKQMMDQSIRVHSTNELNQVKELIQELVLCGLSRAGFFKNCAFYGGTALRIVHGLDRFSEDLDFSLKVAKGGFDFNEFIPTLERELIAYGLNMKIEVKHKSKDSDVKSAFLKGYTQEHMLLFYASDALTGKQGLNNLIKIKFEVDTNPPDHAHFETKYRLLPIPYELSMYDLPSLFAGKIHAVLCRSWKKRVKGRDLYDYVYYRARNIQVNLKHLEARLRQTGHFTLDRPLGLEDVQAMLVERFNSIDYEQAKQDVIPFISDRSALDLWSSTFFIEISKQLEVEE